MLPKPLKDHLHAAALAYLSMCLRSASWIHLQKSDKLISTSHVSSSYVSESQMLGSTLCQLLNTDGGSKFWDTWWIWWHSSCHLQAEMPPRCLQSSEVPQNSDQSRGSTPKPGFEDRRVPGTRYHLVTLAINAICSATKCGLQHSLSWVTDLHQSSQITSPDRKHLLHMCLNTRWCRKHRSALLELFLMLTPNPKPYVEGSLAGWHSELGIWDS